MLTTSPKSRRQLAMGGATVSLLVLSGLGLTASGTPAAAALTKKVERTIGVDLTSTDLDTQIDEVAAMEPDNATEPTTMASPVPVASVRRKARDVATASMVPMAPMPPMKPMAPMPAMAPMAPMPPMAPMTADMSDMPKVPGTYRSRVITTRDGKTIRIGDNGRAYAMPPIPMVRSQACGTGGSDTRTSYTTVNGTTRQQVTVICTDRIEQRARQASATALSAQRTAQVNMRIALASIENARSSIARDRNLSEEARREALNGLNEAKAQLKSEMANRADD